MRLLRVNTGKAVCSETEVHRSSARSNLNQKGVAEGGWVAQVSHTSKSERCPISRVLCEKWGLWTERGSSTQAPFRLGSLSQHKTDSSHSPNSAKPGCPSGRGPRGQR